MLESDWNWNLKFGILGQYGQKTIFQTKWRKNTVELKIYLVRFSSTMWRGQFALKFIAQNIWRKQRYKIFMLFSQGGSCLGGLSRENCPRARLFANNPLFQCIQNIMACLVVYLQLSHNWFPKVSSYICNRFEILYHFVEHADYFLNG